MTTVPPHRAGSGPASPGSSSLPDGPGVPAAPAPVGRSRFRSLGTYGELLVTERSALGPALELLQAELAAIDLACSRFRPDSELRSVNAAAGRPVPVSPLLAEAVATGLAAARRTAGDVDPTMGDALVAAGYDDDFAALPPDGPAVTPRPASGAWRDVEVDVDAGVLRTPPGVTLDLGATAKALAADRAAAAIAGRTGSGVLVNLGGDLAVAGTAPAGGWPVNVTDGLVGGPAVGAGPADPGVPAPPAPTGQVVRVSGGGLATSSTAVRRWTRGGETFHHILDPRTGLPATPYWRTVTVTAASCVDANTASTAAVVRGPAATEWLTTLRLPSRLVTSAGEVHRVAGWPAEVAA